jgi:hypothetical protein
MEGEKDMQTLKLEVLYMHECRSFVQNRGSRCTSALQTSTHKQPDGIMLSEIEERIILETYVHTASTTTKKKSFICSVLDSSPFEIGLRGRHRTSD